MTRPDSPVASAYRDLLRSLDAWFAESSAANPGVVPCRAGCTQCCHGPFDISVSDALLVRQALEGLEPAQREQVARRAASQVSRMRALEPGWRMEDGVAGLGEEQFDRLAEALADEPCPALSQDGACLVYQDRPLVCRIMGLGIRTPAGRVIENGCPIQDEFPAYRELGPQPLDLESLEELELACHEAASLELFGTPARAGHDTTIALAITCPSSPR